MRIKNIQNLKIELDGINVDSYLKTLSNAANKKSHIKTKHIKAI